ncbi:MAG: AAA family ATPase [Oscillospiraceae bacterium]|nr:AAA family ATPase [Oscillospiraceae bacterium]
MTKSKVIMVCSWKGGVGKSTVAANLALALAKMNKRVLICDCDFKMRCLDLIMGHQDDMMFNMADVIAGSVGLSKAIVHDSRGKNFWLCGAPSGDVEIDTEDFRKFIAAATDLLATDYIILDTAGTNTESFHMAASVADIALIVANHSPTSIRAAEATAAALGDSKAEPLLVINGFDTNNIAALASGKRSGVIDIIEQTSIRLIGVVPHSYGLQLAQEKGKLYNEVDGDIKCAMSNIAKRIEGIHVPLFQGFRQRKKIKKTM